MTKLLHFAIIAISLILFPTLTYSQIYNPEGLNMPGEWNSWVNPPSNNPAFASSTQVVDGRIAYIDIGTLRWQTIFEVGASGDVSAGTYNWLFTSGPDGTPFQNKWADVSVITNTLQDYTLNGTTDNNISLSDGFWYTMVWEDIGYENTRAIFMETSAEPVEILTVSLPATVNPNDVVPVTITTNGNPSPEEVFYLRYSNDNWVTSSAVDVAVTGSTGTATIPGQPAGTTVQYYVFSSTVPSVSSDYDLYTIKLNNNSGTNYEYTVSGTPAVEIDWANLQYPESGSIVIGDTFDVYAQVYIAGYTDSTGQASNVQGWIGFNDEDTDPGTWTDWLPATYNADVGNNDEYFSNIGLQIFQEGTYYYASRFQYTDQTYVYGGFSASGGGFWDGTDNVSGVLTVTGTPPDPEIGWANLQHPDSGMIEPGQEYFVYAQAWIDGITGQGTVADGLEGWIGYNDEDTDPLTWNNWIQADYFGASGSNDEFIADLGEFISDTGTYYYASRFKYLDQNYVYGGYSDDGGGFWDGVSYVSGVLSVIGEIVTYTVDFLVTDATGLYSNIKFKGAMTNWEPVNMIQNNELWSLTLEVEPGSYEWGVMEDDGSTHGIWLVIGPNLVVNIDDNGTISGDTTYVITYVGIQETNDRFNVYPNPVSNTLNVTSSDYLNNAIITIFTAEGRKCTEFIMDGFNQNVDLSECPGGVYYLSIKNNNEVLIKKIIKQ